MRNLDESKENKILKIKLKSAIKLLLFIFLIINDVYFIFINTEIMRN